MSKRDYNRYELYINLEGGIDQIPYVKIPENESDKYIKWDSRINRFDKLSNKYYNNPFYDFLILFANPQYLNEFDINDGALIRIPFPLEKAKLDYENGLKIIKSR